jgi:arylsulfatase A-like enzyme
MKSRPNIVYLHSHDTGRHIAPYGVAVRTPNLQRVAEQGVLFRQAFCAAPTCSPSRAALLTGMSAHQTGMLGLAHRGFRLADPSKHLPRQLSSHGYDTALCGVQHEAPGADVASLGYAHIEKTLNQQSGAAAAALLDSGKLRSPFFLSVGLFQTHREFPDPARTDPTTDPRYVGVPPYLPDTPAVRGDIAALNTMAASMDEQYGLVLDALDRNGLADNTLVFCTTDHGIAFPNAKCTLRDSGIGVLLLMRGPGGFTGGKVVDALVSHLDVAPTLFDVIGLDPPGWYQGRSLRPLLDGSATSIRDELFAEVTYHAAYEPQRCIRTERWKYIRRFDHRDKPVLPNCDDSPTRSAMLDAGVFPGPVEEALYDLLADPLERVNLASEPAYAAMRRELAARLDDWMRRTDDPLPCGPVPPPSGALLNDPDQSSPKEATTTVP